MELFFLESLGPPQLHVGRIITDTASVTRCTLYIASKQYTTPYQPPAFNRCSHTESGNKVCFTHSEDCKTRIHLLLFTVRSTSLHLTYPSSYIIFFKIYEKSCTPNVPAELQMLVIPIYLTDQLPFSKLIHDFLLLLLRTTQLKPNSTSKQAMFLGGDYWRSTRASPIVPCTFQYIYVTSLILINAPRLNNWFLPQYQMSCYLEFSMNLTSTFSSSMPKLPSLPIAIFENGLRCTCTGLVERFQ